MPERYLYAHGTCAVCGYEGGLVIASPSDPRCWPCEDWAQKQWDASTGRTLAVEDVVHLERELRRGYRGVVRSEFAGDVDLSAYGRET